MNVPFVDLRAQYESIRTEIDCAIASVIKDVAFVGGRYVFDFELQFAEKYGVKHCIGVGNGTDSLYIILKMLGIGTGDEVITSAYSWISSSETISQAGATPVFVDIDPRYFTLDEELIAEKITARTKAIIAVHIHGQMCAMDRILETAARRNIAVIEDCAQSHFSEFEGLRAGTMGIAGSFSFYPGKNLGAYGDAGSIITNDAELAKRCKMFANHGALQKHQHQIEGINSRLDGLQAAILLAKLPHVLDWTRKRKEHAGTYTKLLTSVPQVEVPPVRPGCEHTFTSMLSRHNVGMN
jgi:dTDP-4-amino-4,6-dideoxygalactose transaminase